MIRRRPIVSGLLILATLAVCWFIIRTIVQQVNGPSSLSATHYWKEDAVSISWKWRKTAVRRKENDLDQTTCIAHGTIQNHDKVRLLNVRKVDLILQDGNGIELHRKSYYFGSKGTNLTPDESKEFTMSYWVPTGFLRDVRKLSAGLAYEFKVQEEKQ